MTIRKLSAMPYAQAHVEIDDKTGDIYLFSYVTLVAAIEHDENGERWLSLSGLYSMTTRKHISAFMREYTEFGYSTAKMCVTDNVRMNLDTGEIEELDA